MNIYGFVGKPETAKKTRGDQYFFVNNRFIKSAYLNHAVLNAYQELITMDSFPMYVLFIDLDPAVVDVNVHPTKQEIKFEDEKIIYAFVQASVRHALAQFSITPTLDFDLDPSIQQLPSIQQPFTEERQAAAVSTSIFKGFTQKNQAHFIEKSELRNWKEFYETGSQKPEVGSRSEENIQQPTINAQYSIEKRSLITDIPLVQLHKQFIVAGTENGFIIINQQSAHERILYEQLTMAMLGKRVTTQHTLFPTSLVLSPPDAILLEELLEDLSHLGYLIEPFGKDAFIIQGTPADVEQGNEKIIIDELLEQYKHFSSDVKFSKRERLIRSVAKQRAVKAGQSLTEQEMKSLVEQLFVCKQPNAAPDGNPTYLEFKKEQLEKMFGK